MMITNSKSRWVGRYTKFGALAFDFAAFRAGADEKKNRECLV